MIDYNSPSSIRAFLEKNEMAMQKKFGQNFLISEDARNRLVAALDAQKGERVWEVGAGLGAMTALLLKTGCNLTAFEIDRGFLEFLRASFGREPNFRLVEGDVLRTWKLQKGENPSKFFGNLPYNIAATLFASLIEGEFFFESGVITVQKDVAIRMTAKCGSKEWSSFSALCQSTYKIKRVCDLGARLFWPQPNVVSQAVRFEKCLLPCKRRDFFPKFLRGVFSSRRKTLKNNLSAFFSSEEKADALLDFLKIDPKVRAESLETEVLLRMSDFAAELV